VYQVLNEEVVVLVIVVDRSEHERVYGKAAERLK
jgi:hypothetical protein